MVESPRQSQIRTKLVFVEPPNFKIILISFVSQILQLSQNELMVQITVD
jgi:hypothetical protein